MPMTDVLDRRLTTLENVVWDIPNLLNTRTERYESEFSDIRNRLQQLDRTMTLMQADVRDLRNGVTRQLVAQDEAIRELKADLGTVKADVGTLKADTKSLKDDMERVKAGIAELLARQPRAT